MASRQKHTDIGAEIHGLEDLDGQVGLDFADNFNGIIES